MNFISKGNSTICHLWTRVVAVTRYTNTHGIEKRETLQITCYISKMVQDRHSFYHMVTDDTERP